jgi:hypothetical protein
MKGQNKIKSIQFVPGSHIVDSEYTGCTGGTKPSLQFWDLIKGRIKPVVKARMMFNKTDWWRLILTTEDNVEIELTGCAGGFHGEGPRGTQQILKDCGFDESAIEAVVFKQETFIMKRSVENETFSV